MRFQATLELGGKTATGIQVPEEVVMGLGSHKQPRVRVTIGGHTYRTTVAVRGGRFLIPVSAENRAGAGIVAGDELDIDIELDTEPREVSVPPDFADALTRDTEARRSFESLSPATSSATYWRSSKRRNPRPGSDASTRRSTCSGKTHPSADAGRAGGLW